MAVTFREIMVIILWIQAITMVLLGVYFLTTGQARLGYAQFLLAAVTILVYSGGL